MPRLKVRFFLTSTCTDFERPCEKLWRMFPPSMVFRNSTVPGRDRPRGLASFGIRVVAHIARRSLAASAARNPASRPAAVTNFAANPPRRMAR